MGHLQLKIQLNSELKSEESEDHGSSVTVALLNWTTEVHIRQIRESDSVITAGH